MAKALNRLRRGAAPVWRPGAAILDQAICAVTNFLTMVVLARLLAVGDLGIFVLAFGVQAIAVTLQSINFGPMRVHGATIAPADQRRYFSGQLGATISCATALCGTLLVIVSCLGWLAWPTAVAFSIYVFSAQLYEFLRVKNMTLLQMGRLLSQDAITLVLRAALFGLAWLASVQSLSGAFVILILAFLISSLVDGINDRALLSPTLSPGVLRDNVRHGKWWVLEGLGYATTPQFVNFLVASALGSQAVAGLGAVQSLMNAPGVIGVGVSNLTVPVARRALLEKGVEKWRETLVFAGVAICMAQWLLLGVIYLIGETALIWVYGANFGKFAALLPFGCLQYVALAAGIACSVAYRTVERMDLVFAGYSVAGLVTILATPPLVDMWGLNGAAIALAVYCWLWLLALVVCLPAAIPMATTDSARNQLSRAQRVSRDGTEP